MVILSCPYSSHSRGAHAFAMLSSKRPAVVGELPEMVSCIARLHWDRVAPALAISFPTMATRDHTDDSQVGLWKVNPLCDRQPKL
jgi:hypothetical protein